MPIQHTEETRLKISESMKGNRNSEKWTLEMAITLFEQAVELTQDPSMVFVGTLAKKLNTTRNIMYYLGNEKFKSELHDLYEQLLNNLESNCFELSLVKGVNHQPLLFALKSFYPETWNQPDKKEITTNAKTTIVWNETKNYLPPKNDSVQYIDAEIVPNKKIEFAGKPLKEKPEDEMPF